MKHKVNWAIVLVVLSGFMFGGLLGNLFSGTFLNYGQNFGLSSPVVLDLGFIIFTFGLTIHITVASVVGVVIALVLYRLLR